MRTRDALRKLAEREGHTFGAQIKKMVSRERRRVIGAQLANDGPMPTTRPCSTLQRAKLLMQAGDIIRCDFGTPARGKPASN